MLYDEKITGESRNEMLKFLRFANGIGETPLLFGGWAVYQYNPYAGSRDVDFVVSDGHFDKCVDFLVNHEGYTLKAGRLIKGEIFFDLYKRSEGLGNPEIGLDFDILYRNAERIYLRGEQYEILMPRIADLFFFKVHALANRDVPKDKSDALALLLKFSDKDFSVKSRLDGRMRQKLETLINKIDVLSLIVKPTGKNITNVNERIKKLVG